MARSKENCENFSSADTPSIPRPSAQVEGETDKFEALIGKKAKLYLSNGAIYAGIVEDVKQDFVTIRNCITKRLALANKTFIIAVTTSPN